MVTKEFVENLPESETKMFYFGVFWQMYGSMGVRVPKSFSENEARDYVNSIWGDLPLPAGDYVSDSDEPDFENSDFDE